jgi:hypothetical protein
MTIFGNLSKKWFRLLDFNMNECCLPNSAAARSMILDVVMISMSPLGEHSQRGHRRITAKAEC